MNINANADREGSARLALCLFDDYGSSRRNRLNPKIFDERSISEFMTSIRSFRSWDKLTLKTYSSELIRVC
jgi:hypothetical protein